MTLAVRQGTSFFEEQVHSLEMGCIFLSIIIPILERLSARCGLFSFNFCNKTGLNQTYQRNKLVN